MGANAKRGSRTQNEIVASKRELPVKNIKTSVFIPNSVLLHYIIMVHLYVYIRKGITRLCDSVKYLIISALRYLIIPFTVRAWSGTRSLLRALETERNRVRS